MNIWKEAEETCAESCVFFGFVPSCLRFPLLVSWLRFPLLVRPEVAGCDNTWATFQHQCSKVSKSWSEKINKMVVTIQMRNKKYNGKDNPRDPGHLRHWLQFWQLRTRIHDNLWYLTINCDTGQHSQFLRCFILHVSLVLEQFSLRFKTCLSNAGKFLRFTM